jgi:hypothetical protein
MVQAEDTIIIPTAVAHDPSGAKDHEVHLSVRPEPDRVLPVGLVYPPGVEEPAGRSETAPPAR